MWGSYGSYSSMSANTAPMDITFNNMAAHDKSCAFPSWPRRSSLDNEESQRPTSFLSDDDLLFLCESPIEDDSSVSSASSSVSTSPAQHLALVPEVAQAEVFEMERQRRALQAEYMRQMVADKERRRHARRSGRRMSEKKASPKSKLSNMTPIAE